MAKSDAGKLATAGEAPWPSASPPPVGTSAPANFGMAQSQSAPPISLPQNATIVGPSNAGASTPRPVVPAMTGVASNAPNAIPPISTGPNAPPAAGAPGDGDDEQLEDPIEVATRLAPPWLLSCVLHMLVLIILGLSIVANLRKPQIELEVAMVYSETLGDQILDDSIPISTPTPEPNVERAELAISELPEVADPFAAPQIQQFAPDAKTGAIANMKAPAIGNALSGRQAGRKSRLLGKYGGNATTEAAVANALIWLKRNQRQDGSWALNGPYKDGAVYENPIAATAMALLAFQGAGHTHQEGEHKKVVERGWYYLLRQQNGEGLFVTDSYGHLIYSHAQATIAVCELYGMTNDARFRQSAESAAQYCVRIQAPEGGWKYTPGQGSDMSVTGWVVMALQSARMAGLDVPPQAFEKVSKFIDSVSLEDGSRYVYEPGNGIRDPSMTAEALLCRQYLGWTRDDARLKKGVDYLLENRIGKGDQNVYYWYYATQVVHHMEGDAWQKWNEAMRELLPQTQLKAGGEAGSWDPGADSWGSSAGRLYVTCMSTYMLEVYYRHLPIYTKVFDQR